ncbi:hypothetical protein COY90_01275 [Candidatus Roizmanbacteria bacterium CG_4_10_14_0_8_um_filter_39_9]|uniref:Uncharacterized protein n=1 Tax=Candidatus Roizmanbacteria bacterium CG_4_10_14_0_8_um_filter_39_9 TaxID=1974829 RepID=A0A2M7QDL6_9BACT|nr:MAG: hypothetical protein COY90_01275 [Candidatus Roizmanbacteria bacterium CG_4_10_14_0_8_um_filter_39_9]
MQRNHKIQQLLTSYGLTGLGFTAIYLTLFHSHLFASQHILFYRGLGLLVISMAATLLIGVSIYRYIARFSIESFIAALIMSVSIHLALFVVFPVTFDRSVTMYMLNKLKTQNSKVCEGTTVDSLEESFINEYVRRDDAVNRRIDEQSLINIVNNDAGCISLTQRGKGFLKWSETIKKLYNIQ